MRAKQINVPPRSGPRPSTTPTNPHSQLDQNAPPHLQDRLRDHALSLPGVVSGMSHVSVPGSIAFLLNEPPEAPTIPALLGAEWGHIHPHHDGSLHINMPTELADQVVAAGWGEYHCLVRPGIIPPIVILLYGPRDEDELAVCKRIVEESYLAAGGNRVDQSGQSLGF